MVKIQRGHGSPVTLYDTTDTEIGTAANPLSITGSFSASTSAHATASPPSYSEGTDDALSQDLSGHLRTIAEIDQTTPGLTNLVDASNFPATADVNAGAAGTSTIRVVLATGGATPLPTGAATATLQSTINTTLGSPFQAGGALAANQTVNVALINGATPLMGAGITGTGSPRVTISTDQAAIAAAGQGATAGNVPSGAEYQGWRGTTANPTAVTDGQLVGGMADAKGRQVVVLNQVRDLVSDQTTSAIVDTTVTPIVTAAASTFNDIVSFIFANSGSATTITIKDDTTTRVTFYLPANDTRGVPLSVPFKQATVNKNWTATCTGTPSVIVTTQFVKNT